MRSFPFLGNQEQCVGFNLFSTFLYFPHLVISPIDTLWVTEKSTVGPCQLSFLSRYHACLSPSPPALLFSLLPLPSPVLLPGKSHGWRSLVGYSPWSREELDTTEQLHFHFSLSCTREGNANPLQYGCLENPRDRSLVGCRLWGHTESDMTDVT